MRRWEIGELCFYLVALFFAAVLFSVSATFNLSFITSSPFCSSFILQDTCSILFLLPAQYHRIRSHSLAARAICYFPQLALRPVESHTLHYSFLPRLFRQHLKYLTLWRE